MFSKFEMISAGVCVGLIALAIYLVQVETTLSPDSQPAAVVTSGATVVPQTETGQPVPLAATTNQPEEINTMKINDIKIGAGATASDGDTVAVHYVGRLQDGTEFDNSHKRGAPIEFKLGAGQVIAGWEEGIVGMQVRGERTLVIPPEKAYGERGIGPIPGGATLTFAVELVEIK